MNYASFKVEEEYKTSAIMQFYRNVFNNKLIIKTSELASLLVEQILTHF